MGRILKNITKKEGLRWLEKMRSQLLFYQKNPLLNRSNYNFQKDKNKVLQISTDLYNIGLKLKALRSRIEED